MTRDDYTEPDAVFECDECGEECDAYAEDVGIGAYEFWGACGVDSRIEWSSRCCDAPVHQIR